TLSETPNEHDAVRAAIALAQRLNHLYALLEKAGRPYHFYGAALVACELVSRGHSPEVTVLAGGALGDLYETATSPNGRPDAGDVALHREGSRYGAQVCSTEGAL